MDKEKSASNCTSCLSIFYNFSIAANVILIAIDSRDTIIATGVWIPSTSPYQFQEEFSLIIRRMHV